MQQTACCGLGAFPLEVARFDQAQLAGGDPTQGDGGTVVHDRIKQLLRRRIEQVAELEPQFPPFVLRLNVHASQLLDVPDGTQAAPA